MNIRYKIPIRLSYINKSYNCLILINDKYTHIYDITLGIENSIQSLHRRLKYGMSNDMNDNLVIDKCKLNITFVDNTDNENINMTSDIMLKRKGDTIYDLSDHILKVSNDMDKQTVEDKIDYSAQMTINKEYKNNKWNSIKRDKFKQLINVHGEFPSQQRGFIYEYLLGCPKNNHG